MARVNRFIFNSDFMTIAKNSRQTFTVTIPSGETLYGIYTGSKTIKTDIPAGCWPRCKVAYTAANNRTRESVCEGLFVITANKNGKTINYICTFDLCDGEVIISYFVINATDSTTVLTDAQTVTITFDFMEQPNT